MKILATGLQYLRGSLTQGCSGVYRTRRILSYLEYQNSILHLNYTNFILTLGPKRNRKCECTEDGRQCAVHTYNTTAIAHARWNEGTALCKVDVKTVRKERKLKGLNSFW